MDPNDPWFHKVYVRGHFVGLSAGLINDLFNLFACDLHTEFENENVFDMERIVTTVSHGLIN